MDDHSVQAQVDLALSIVKRVEREARIAKQALGRLRDDLNHTPTAQEGTRTDDPAD